MSEFAKPTTPELTVLLPCLNEARTVAACVQAARKGAVAAGVDAEILVADNGSADGSPSFAVEAGARVLHVEARGYGHVLRAGIKGARGRWVVMGDADLSYDFTRIGPFLEKLREGADLVMGCRLPAGGGTVLPGAMPWMHRWLGNPVLTGIGRLWFGVRVHDFHCGLRAFSRDAMLRLDLRTGGMEFASEMIIKAAAARLRIEEVPVVLSPDGRDRPSHLRTWRDGWRHLRYMLLCSPRWLFLYPGIALLLVGVLAGAWLLPGPRQVGEVELDVHTLLYAAAAVLVGFQTVVFAVSLELLARVEVGSAGPARRRAWRMPNLERWLLLGAGLMMAGLLGSFCAIGIWRGTNFGRLNPSETLRLVIPSVTALALGIQATFAGFFWSSLTLRQPADDR